MSKTPGLKDAPLGRVQLPSSGGSGTWLWFPELRQAKRQSTALGLVWAIPHTSRALVEDARSCPELDSKSRLIGISQGDRYKRGVSSENQVWEGQNGAMRRRRAPLTFTLHSTAGISFNWRKNAYRLTFGRIYAQSRRENSGRTRAGTGMTLEKQRGPPPLCQTDPRSGTPSDGSTSIPPGLSFCLDRKSAARFSIPEREPPSKRGTCLGTKGEDGTQACPGARTVNLLDGLLGHNRRIVHPDYDMIPPRTWRKYFKAR